MDPLDAPRIWVEKLHEGVGCRSRECATAQSSCDDEAYSQEIEISGYSCFSSASSLSDVDEVLWDAGTLKAAANGLERRGNGRGSSSTYFTHRTCEVGGAGERSREHDKRRWEVGAIASEMAMLQLAAGGGEAWAAWGDAECYSSSGSESQDENQVQNWGPRAARRSEKGRSRAGEEAVRWVNNATYFFNMSDVQHEHQWELQQGRRAAAVSGPSAVASRAVAVIIAAEQGEQPRGRCGEGQAAGSWGVPGEELRQAPEQNIPLFDWESTNPLYYAPPLCSEQPAQPEPADRHCPVPAAEACLAAPSASSERAQLPRYARRTWKPPTAAPQQLRPSPSSTRYAASGRRLAKPASRVAVPVAHQDHSCLLVEQRVDFAATNTRVASVETKAAVCPVIPAEQRSGDGVAVLPHGNSTAQTAAAGAVAQQRPAAVEMLGVEAAEQLQEAVRLCTDAARYGTPYGDAGDGCDVVESPAAASCPLPQHGTAPLDLGLHRLRPSGAHDVGVEAEPVRAVLSSDVAPRVPSCELETSSNPAYSCEKPPRADRSVSHCFGAAPAAARMVRWWVSCFRPPPGGGVRD